MAIELSSSGVFEMIYQHSDNFFDVRLTDFVGDYEDPNDFSEIEYLISDRRGRTKIALTLNNGLSIVSSDDNQEKYVRVHIDDALINFSGNFYDQLVTYDLAGNKQLPRFQRKIRIKKVFKNTLSNN